jgi:DNA replication and repair protein RecF
MWIQRLRIAGFRCIATADLQPSSGLNVVVGGNGMGKTSVLEAIAVAASGRSFRTVRPEEMCAVANTLQLVVDVGSAERATRIGVQRDSQRWVCRIDGAPANGFADVAEHLAVEVFEPNSHEIVSGSSERRRRFLDWGVFHVEQSFGPNWSRYQRGLKQRNALLRSGQATPERLLPWNRELIASGNELTQLRESFIDTFTPVLTRHMNLLAPELGQPELRFKRGWTGDTLADAVAGATERDLALGHTTRGPHRCDWQLRFDGVGGRERWSRGQQKIAVFGLCRAMLDVYAERRGEPAVACLDDVFSELDEHHQVLCLHSLQAANAQIWITGTERLRALQQWTGEQQTFHVEHGRVTPHQPSAL